MESRPAKRLSLRPIATPKTLTARSSGQPTYSRGVHVRGVCLTLCTDDLDPFWARTSQTDSPNDFTSLSLEE